jgi:hypothetical protein
MSKKLKAMIQVPLNKLAKNVSNVKGAILLFLQDMNAKHAIDA